jgi:hypothetical protein
MIQCCNWRHGLWRLHRTFLPRTQRLIFHITKDILMSKQWRAVSIAMRYLKLYTKYSHVATKLSVNKVYIYLTLTKKTVARHTVLTGSSISFMRHSLALGNKMLCVNWRFKNMNRTLSYLQEEVLNSSQGHYFIINHWERICIIKTSLFLVLALTCRETCQRIW